MRWSTQWSTRSLAGGGPGRDAVAEAGVQAGGGAGGIGRVGPLR
ncbi:hypothetical protein [Saccharothrix syringae]|nr:hypothetical protein [Saccharothrix syringae]